MQGHPEVIAQLNHLLANELTAIDQYFLHGRLCHEWGFSKLHMHLEHEMQEEQAHAQRLINRLLLLDTVPSLSHRHPLNIGQRVPDILENDLGLEYRVIADLREAIAVCERAGDFVSRDLLLDLLKDTEEDHTRWLETQLQVIKRVGLENYLQSQI